MIEEQVCRRVPRWFSRHGLVDSDAACDCDRLAWENGGFSLDASVCIAGQDRAERLPRYCARPRFAVSFTGYSRQSVGNYQGQLLASCCPHEDPRVLAWSGLRSRSNSGGGIRRIRRGVL